MTNQDARAGMKITKNQLVRLLAGVLHALLIIIVLVVSGGDLPFSAARAGYILTFS